MSMIWLIARRELLAFVRAPIGYIIAAAFLFLLGLDFNLRVMGDTAQFSADVLTAFFHELSGFVILFSLFISMGLLAREREAGTITLLLTSPVRDSQVVLGKYLGALLYFLVLLVLTGYMPLMVLVNGKVSMGHVLAGYLGVFLLGSACLSIGIFGSSLTRNQLVAVFATLVIGMPLVLFWVLGKVADKPFDEIFAYLSLHNLHFLSFKSGKVHLRDIVYYLSVSSFFLFGATRMLESRRWR